MQQSNNAIIPFTPIDSPQDIVITRWRDLIGVPTPQVRNILASYTERLGDWDVCYAIEETAMAPQPSLRYCVAILRRLEQKKGN